jgi:proteasome lid subunit RPN8/RPN11
VLYILLEDFLVHPDHLHNTWPHFWNVDLEEQFATIAKNKYPQEAVCLLTNDGLVELENISDTPSESYESIIPPEMYNDIIGIIHSHPDTDVRPSKQDCMTQLALDVPSGIVSVSVDSISVSFWAGDHLLEKSLLERPFHHVYYDCYSLIRSYYYQEKGITLKDYPREDDWWVLGENMYEDLFRDAGFSEVTTSGIEVGDVVFMKINSNTINHAGVYVGDDNILHHLNGRLSRIDKYSTWARIVDKLVRYNN